MYYYILYHFTYTNHYFYSPPLHRRATIDGVSLNHSPQFKHTLNFPNRMYLGGYTLFFSLSFPRLVGCANSFPNSFYKVYVKSVNYWHTTYPIYFVFIPNRPSALPVDKSDFTLDENPQRTVITPPEQCQPHNGHPPPTRSQVATFH